VHVPEAECPKDDCGEGSECDDRPDRVHGAR
jgi:hypothetical protein